MLYTPTVENSFTWLLLRHCPVPKDKDPELYYHAFLVPRVRDLWNNRFDAIQTSIREASFLTVVKTVFVVKTVLKR